MITSIIAAIVIGAIIGVLGRLALPGKQNISLVLTIAVGIVAALIGTAIARAMGVENTNGIDWVEHLIQIILAAVGVAIVAGATGRNTNRVH
jgi:uncharacterized membrane protein YeaQ/YmgE (transglycosylase-associated protein family)